MFKNIERIKNDAKSLSGNLLEIFNDAREILKDHITPQGTNSSKGDLDVYRSYMSAVEKYGDIEYSNEVECLDDLEGLIFSYFAIFDGGYKEMITHSQCQRIVWWIKEIQQEDKEKIDEIYKTNIS